MDAARASHPDAPQLKPSDHASYVRRMDPIRAVAYANYPNVALHRAVMRVLIDNRARGARPRMGLAEIAARRSRRARTRSPTR